jgi:hypothetical protein
MPYNTNSNLFYIHIPKTGGSSIELCLNLDQLIGGYRYEYIKNGSTIRCKSSPQHLTLDILEDAVEHFNHFEQFTVVRNPYDRLVSEYHFSYDCRTENKIMLFLKKNNLFSFDDFIKYIFLNMSEDERQLKFDNHFVPQIRYTQGKTPVKVFKFENLNNLQDWLREKTNNENLVIPHEMKSQTRKPYLEYFNNQEILDIVNEYYIDDFTAFNYQIIRSLAHSLTSSKSAI